MMLVFFWVVLPPQTVKYIRESSLSCSALVTGVGCLESDLSAPRCRNLLAGRMTEYQNCPINNSFSVLRQEFTRHVNEKGPKKTKERRRRRFELKVSKSSRVDFIYTTQNHKSHRLGGLYKFCSVWHPLSLHPRFKWGNNSIRIKKKI